MEIVAFCDQYTCQWDYNNFQMIFMYIIKLLTSCAQGMVSPRSMSSHVKNNHWTPDRSVTDGQYDQANRTISKKHKNQRDESDNVTQISLINVVAPFQ